MSILVLELLGSMLSFLLSCEIFANSVEHVGNKLGMSHAAAGSLLAAVGTAYAGDHDPDLGPHLRQGTCGGGDWNRSHSGGALHALYPGLLSPGPHYADPPLEGQAQ